MVAYQSHQAIEDILRFGKLGIGRKSWDVAQETLPSTVRVSRGMGLLTAEERREFQMRTHAQEGEEVMSANEINTDLEDEQIRLPL
ncbi:hypothetical protein AXG93_1217s1400 [Marchantia polymorpha subsp. ruderalis]|uniref:Uncharacterized protein n=1 Tax=Marchantia polymorpha subsp. ruderalis TaxID=1480154 RepID=A0A176VSW8_MARPO|nr:hypothetical protein AXG93_1217s1400 [Marchantia polymorpha subsp. ruderalis]